MRSLFKLFSIGLALYAPVSQGATSIGVDLGYRGLSLRTSLDPDTFIQADLGSWWYYSGLSLGADYCKIYPRKKTSSNEPDVFYGFGAEVGTISLDERSTISVIGFRLPFGVSWDIKDTPLQIGAAAVPALVIGPSWTGTTIGLSIPFRWRLD
ncbi:MAG: hypothetical protein RIQ81_2257 [Pseudomonadota bacterium]|jgi:hypothetical protein